MHSLLRSRQGEIDGVCTQLHTGYSRCEHIFARAQGNSTWTPSVETKARNEVDDTVALKKKLVCCIKDAKQMIKTLT